MSLGWPHQRGEMRCDGLRCMDNKEEGTQRQKTYRRRVEKFAVTNLANGVWTNCKPTLCALSADSIQIWSDLTTRLHYIYIYIYIYMYLFMYYAARKSRVKNAEMPRVQLRHMNFTSQAFLALCFNHLQHIPALQLSLLACSV